MQKYKLFIQNIYLRYFEDEIPARGAEISFYILLSFFPFLIFLITFASYMPFLNSDKYITHISRYMPESAYEVVEYIIYKAVSGKSTKLLMISFFITIWSASSAIGAFIKGINKAFDWEEERPFWKIALVSAIYTMELVAVIIFSLLLVVFGKVLGALLSSFLGADSIYLTIWNNARYLVALLTMVVVFLSLYLYTPTRRTRIRNVIPGTVFATIGWIIASLAFSYYANNFANYSEVYGSIGGIIALLTWIYLSGLIMILGAELNASIYCIRTGKTKSKLIRY